MSKLIGYIPLTKLYVLKYVTGPGELNILSYRYVSSLR